MKIKERFHDIDFYEKATVVNIALGSLTVGSAIPLALSEAQMSGQERGLSVGAVLFTAALFFKAGTIASDRLNVLQNQMVSDSNTPASIDQ